MQAFLKFSFKDYWSCKALLARHSRRESQFTLCSSAPCLFQAAYEARPLDKMLEILLCLFLSQLFSPWIATPSVFSAQIYDWRICASNTPSMKKMWKLRVWSPGNHLATSLCHLLVSPSFIWSLIPALWAVFGQIDEWKIDFLTKEPKLLEGVSLSCVLSNLSCSNTFYDPKSNTKP